MEAMILAVTCHHFLSIYTAKNMKVLMKVCCYYMTWDVFKFNDWIEINSKVKTSISELLALNTTDSFYGQILNIYKDM